MTTDSPWPPSRSVVSPASVIKGFPRPFDPKRLIFFLKTQSFLSLKLPSILKTSITTSLQTFNSSPKSSKFFPFSLTFFPSTSILPLYFIFEPYFSPNFAISIPITFKTTFFTFYYSNFHFLPYFFTLTSLFLKFSFSSIFLLIFY